MTTSTRRPLVLLLAGIFALSACGASDDTSTGTTPSNDTSADGASTSVTPDETASEETASEETASEETASEESAPDEATQNDDAVKIGQDAIDAALGDLSDECKAVALSFGAAMASAFGTPEQQADVQQVFDSIEGDVPDELRSDVDVFAAAVTAFYDGRDPSSIAVDPMEFFAALEAPEVAAAAERIQAFMEESCPELATP